MNRAIIIILLLICVRQLSAQWIPLSPLPTDHVINDVCFISAQIGYMVCDYGTILKTNDGGNSWEQQLSGTDNSLNGVFFISENSGHAVGNNGTLLRTVDGGENWILQTLDYPESTLSSVFFTDVNIGYAAGKYTDILGYSWGLFLKTVDGGVSWSQQGNAGNTTYVKSLSLEDSNNGIAIGNTSYGITGIHIIFQTTNGSGWLDIKHVFDHYLTDVCNISPGEYIISGYNGLILKTVDGGTNWSSNIIGGDDLVSLNFVDENIGYVLGDDRLFKTTDGGETWNIQPVPAPTLYGSKLYFYNENLGFYTKDFIYRTENTGLSWTKITEDKVNGVNSLFFLDTLIGYSAGSGISKTSDGGYTWDQETLPVTQILYSVFFTSPSTGFACGQSGTIIKTNDGGETWELKENGSQYDLNSIFFPTDLVGFIVGSSSTILKTEDGGENWTNQSNPANENLFSVYFTDDNNGCAVGFGIDGVIVKTSDGGQNWIKVLELGGWNVITLKSVFFINQNIGWAVGTSDYAAGSILKTIDGGLNWTVLDDGETNLWKNIAFFDENVGYAVGYWGLLCKTIDGGESWSFQNYQTDLHINSVFLVGDNTAYAAGGNLLLKNNNAGTMTNSEDSISASGNQEISLYPNPVSDEMVVRVSDSHETVILQIINLKGELVYSKSFMKNISIDVSFCSSGVYILAVKIDGKYKSSKFIKY